MLAKSIPDDLRRLAAAHGVATAYRNERREPVEVDADVVIRVLGLLDVEAATEADRTAELARLAERDRAGVLAPTIAVRVDRKPPPAARGRVAVSEDGSQIDGARRAARRPLAGLVPPAHTTTGRQHAGRGPAQVPPSPATWGWMLQLYALRSAALVGHRRPRRPTGVRGLDGREHGAGAVLLNPLHAPGPTHPVQPSPYTPSSRRFANPLALRIEDLDAYRRADPDTRAEVDALRVSATTDRIDHDLVWAAKRDALELLWRADGRPIPSTTRRSRRVCGTGPPTARWPNGTAAGGHAGPNRCATSRARRWRRLAGSWRRGWRFTPGCSSAAPSN